MIDHETEGRSFLVRERENLDIMKRHAAALRDMGEDRNLTFTKACERHGLIVRDV